MQSTILVVEDDDSILSILAEALRLEGYRVRTALNGRDALTSAARQTPDLMLSDIGLPFVDGYALAVAMHARGVPVILMTASSLGAPTCASGFIQKPFDLDDMVELVDRVLAESTRSSVHRGRIFNSFNGAFRKWVANPNRGLRSALSL